LELSQLVGTRITVFSDQFPGQGLQIRIVSCTNRRLVAENGSQGDIVENLVNNQVVIIQFQYQGQEISIKAGLRRSGGGRCSFELEEYATPLAHRRFYRAQVESPVNLAPFPSSGSLSRNLSRLRWMATTATNISAGGTLLTVPTMLPESVRLLVNLQQDIFKFPKLVLAEVRHAYKYDDIRCRAGVEFLTREQAARIFSPFQMSELPPASVRYSNARRDSLDRAIREWDATMNSKPYIGVLDENQ
jgi:hypothetical protein